MFPWKSFNCFLFLLLSAFFFNIQGVGAAKWCLVLLHLNSSSRQFKRIPFSFQLCEIHLCFFLFCVNWRRESYYLYFFLPNTLLHFFFLSLSPPPAPAKGCVRYRVVCRWSPAETRASALGGLDDCEIDSTDCICNMLWHLYSQSPHFRDSRPESINVDFVI